MTIAKKFHSIIRPLSRNAIHQTGLPSVLMLSVMLLIVSGCGQNGEPQPRARNNAPRNGEAAENSPLPAKNGDRKLADRQAGNMENSSDEFAPQPANDLDRLTQPIDAPPPNSKNPLMRGLESLLGQDRIIEDEQKDGLREMLEEADDALTRVKRENREALRNVNRQMRAANRLPPNILLIVADDLGCGDLGCYGQTQIQTPSIDRLSREGARLTDFYANSPDGATSRWCLLSGKHTGNLPKSAALPPALLSDDFTLGEMLWQANYDTKWIGKWGLRCDNLDEDLPLSHGFEHWWGTADSLDQSDLFPARLWNDDSQVGLPANANGQREVAAAEIFSQEAISYLERANARRPFFLVVSYPLPSTMTESNRMDVAPYANEDWPEDKKQHAARVTRLDVEIGRLLETLNRNGLDRRTIVCVTSDNSPAYESDGRKYFSSPNELRIEVGKMYEGSLRIPCLIRWPGRIQPGQTVSYPGYLSDLYPTFADMGAVLRRGRGIDGHSLVKALQGVSHERQDILYWQMNSPEFTQSVRKGEWKVVRPANIRGIEDLELYNLKKDPGETTNVAADHPEVIKTMLAKPSRDQGA